MKKPTWPAVHNRRLFQPILRSVRTRSGALRANALNLLRALLWMAFFPASLLIRTALFFDALAQATVRCMILICSAILGVTVLAAVCFALLRTLLYPWFN